MSRRNQKNASQSSATKSKSAVKAPPLPDTSEWKPRSKVSDRLSAAFQGQCAASEELIRLRATLERRFNIDNYDSGPGVEDVIREEFRRLIPGRYGIRPGVLVDKKGYSSGDFDLVILNEHWFTSVKAGATRESRRSHFPIEGTYGVIEIKQTLDWNSFDAGMAKLVSAHRLHRPRTCAHRVTENREGSDCDHGLTNPLYSAIIATDLAGNVEMKEMANRFFDICKTLKRLETVRALCVLGHGTLVWGWRDRDGVNPALFMNDDLCRPIVPVYLGAKKGGTALYHLMSNILLHLFHSILGPEDVAALYGDGKPDSMVPKDLRVEISADPEWIQKYKEPCPH